MITPPAEVIAKRFQEGLGECKPLLFNMAEQVSAAASQNSWDLIIGDDCSGRPVTRFVRKALELQGFSPPTAYVCTSQRTRMTTSEGTYDRYLDNMASYYDHPERILFVSEKLGSGETAAFIGKLLRRHFQVIDFAFLAARYDPPPYVDSDKIFFGGIGIDAGMAVYGTFESVVKLSSKRAQFNQLLRRFVPEALRQPLFRNFPLIRTSSSHPLHNLVPGEGQPIASLAPGTTYRELTLSTFLTMDTLAREFVQTKSTGSGVRW